MIKLSLWQAEAILAGVFAKATEIAAKPLSVAVLDGGGNLIAFARQDGAAILRPQIAIAKAGGALGLGTSSRKIWEMAQERPAFVMSLGSLSACGVVPSPGGVLIIGDDGTTIAAVGVSGDLPDVDELCALAGIGAVGLLSQDGL